MRIYNPGPAFSIVHGRGTFSADEHRTRQPLIEQNEKAGRATLHRMPASKPKGHEVPARAVVDVPDVVGHIALRAHGHLGVRRITRPTTEPKEIAAADRHYEILVAKGRATAHPAVPEPVAEEAAVEARPKKVKQPKPAKPEAKPKSKEKKSFAAKVKEAITGKGAETPEGSDDQA